MLVLITGGAGFIGHNLARRALEAGHSVRIFDDFSTGYRENVEGLEADVREASLLDDDALGAAVRGVDSIVHLAALGSVPRSIEDPKRSHEVNASGTLNLLEHARRADVGHVMFSSSSSVYGLNPRLPKKERDWVRPMSPYAVAKLAAEQYVLAYQQSFGIDTLAFRFFNVYGPGQRAGHPYAAVIPVFFEAIKRGEPVWVNGDGTHSRDFTYVETVCDVLLDAVRRRASHPEPVNLAFGTNTSLIQLISVMQGISDRPIQVRFRPTRPGDVPHSQADNTTLLNLFPSVVPVSLQTGLLRTKEWFDSANPSLQRSS
ncbi:NAD-dependent epimerase/dehydratase family protein [Nostocoides australiense]